MTRPIAETGPRTAVSPFNRLPDGPVALTVSIVHYDTPPAVFKDVLDRLCRAIARSREVGAARLLLIDNGGRLDADRLGPVLARHFDGTPHAWKLLSGHGNIGFGRGHNLALPQVRPEGAHLVCNPDVLVAPDALDAGLAVLRRHREAVLVAPRAEGPGGDPQYLCKRYPDLLTLAVRASGSPWLARLFARRLARYELREVVDAAIAEVPDVPLASGAFMLCSGAALLEAGGFDPAYFLYFEDFDLSLRLAELGGIVYAPGVRITHYGGNAAAKGWRHRGALIASAVRFYRRHGLKLA